MFEPYDASGKSPDFIGFAAVRDELPYRLRQQSLLGEFGRSALLVGALAPLGYILVLWAMERAPISHVAPARELATLVGTYFGGRLLKEKTAVGRLLGALCIVAGVICLAASE